MFLTPITGRMLLRTFVCIVLGFPILLSVGVSYAQEQKADTADKVTVRIANSASIEFYKTDTGTFQKFYTDVIVYQGTDTLYCDSLYNFVEKKKLEAFGNVRIAQQGGTEATCNYLRYTSDQRIAFMTGDVRLTDGSNMLWCEELTYNLATKTGVYEKGGTLQSDSTIVWSNSGIYFVKTHEARFTGNVVVSDPRYHITSKDLGYNTETKIETFYDYSVVTSDSGKSILSTQKGTYDSKNVVARFTGKSSIWNDGQYIEADSMHYDKMSGYGFAIGNVVSIDTEQHATIYCGRADFFRKQRVLWAIIKPVMELATGKDTFYMRADTFYSAPMIKMPGTQFRMPVDTEAMPKPIVDTSGNAGVDSTIKSQPITQPEKEVGKTSDTLQHSPVKEQKLSRRERRRLRREERKAKKQEETLVEIEEEEPIDSMWVIPQRKYRLSDFLKDSVTVKPSPSGRKGKKEIEKMPEHSVAGTGDTTSPIFFTGYHHVLIYSDSMQATCDSITFTRSDSIVRLLYDPVAWSRGSQITGDTILMQLDSNSIRSMYVPDNSFIASRSGPEKAAIFDQIQGKTLTAFFTGNTISKMLVNPDAESIYYSKDDDGAYVGVNQASSALMRIYFNNQNISKIKFETDVHQKVTPMDKADLPHARLNRFKWRYDERPKSKEELFR